MPQILAVREVRPDCPKPVHDSLNAYRKGCRCPLARARKQHHDRLYRQRRHAAGWRRCQPARPPEPPDPVVVLRLVRAMSVANVRHCERHAAIDVLDAQGLTAREVAARVGTTTRAVQRQRARRRAREGKK